MKRPKSGDGPWGEAIQYWLVKRAVQQADIAREASIRANTMSRAARGLDTTTRVLKKIAAAFQVPVDDVLISPERRMVDKERQEMIRMAVEEALRRTAPQPTRITGDLLDAELQREEEQEATAERDKTRHKRPEPTRDLKKRLRRSS